MGERLNAPTHTTRIRKNAYEVENGHKIVQMVGLSRRPSAFDIICRLKSMRIVHMALVYVCSTQIELNAYVGVPFGI